MNTERKIKKNKKINIELSECKYDLISKICEEKFNWNIIKNDDKTK